MAEVTLRRLAKSFGRQAVLHAIDLTIADGEFVVLVGPSGCGKSTTLRIIAGLEDASAGDVFIGGRLVNRVEPKDRDIAMVFQNYAIYPHMTVERNIAFGLYTARLAAAEKSKRVRETAAILGLTELLGRKPSQLSGGQRQRVAIGRAMVRSPSVFLFDEPLSNLDAQLRAQMRLEIKKLHQSLRTTIVFVTHDQVEAMTLADRIVVMREGRILQIGAPAEVYRRPADLFVARFIGSPAMNVLPGKVEIAGAVSRVVLENGRGLAPLPPGLAPHGAKAMLGVRPDDLVVLGDGVAELVLGGHVTVTEPLGPDTLVYVDVAGVEVVAKANARTPPKAGDQVRLGAAADALHVFDAVSEKALVSTV